MIEKCNCIYCVVMKLLGDAMVKELEEKMFKEDCDETLKQAKEILDD